MTITSTTIDLTWTAPSGGGAVTGYAVLYRVTGSGAFAILASGVSGTAYTATGLVPTTSYDFAVYAGNSAGPGALSGTVAAETLGAVPNTPGSFATAAGSPAYSSASLSWTAPATDSTHGTAASYTTSYRANNTGAWTVSQTDLTGLSATISGLPHNSLFGFKVDAVNAQGANVAGATATLTTDYAPPNAPAITAVAPVNDGTTSKLAVTWSASATDGTHDAATGYDLQWSVHAANTWTLVSGVNSGAVINGMSANTSYDVQVRAKNGSTTSPGAWSGSTTNSTYKSTVVWSVNQPPTTYAHSSGPPLNVNFSVNPPGVNFAWSASNTVIPTAGLIATTYAGTYYNWAAYPGTPATPGTYYVWAIATDLSGVLVSSAVMIT